jgi:hypothetical protein
MRAKLIDGIPATVPEKAYATYRDIPTRARRIVSFAVSFI